MVTENRKFLQLLVCDKTRVVTMVSRHLQGDIKQNGRFSAMKNECDELLHMLYVTIELVRKDTSYHVRTICT